MDFIEFLEKKKYTVKHWRSNPWRKIIDGPWKKEEHRCLRENWVSILKEQPVFYHSYISMLLHPPIYFDTRNCIFLYFKDLLYMKSDFQTSSLIYLIPLWYNFATETDIFSKIAYNIRRKDYTVWNKAIVHISNVDFLKGEFTPKEAEYLFKMANDTRLCYKIIASVLLRPVHIVKHFYRHALDFRTTFITESTNLKAVTSGLKQCQENTLLNESPTTDKVSENSVIFPQYIKTNQNSSENIVLDKVENNVSTTVNPLFTSLINNDISINDYRATQETTNKGLGLKKGSKSISVNSCNKLSLSTKASPHTMSPKKSILKKNNSIHVITITENEDTIGIPADSVIFEAVQMYQDKCLSFNMNEMIRKLGYANVANIVRNIVFPWGQVMALSRAAGEYCVNPDMEQDIEKQWNSRLCEAFLTLWELKSQGCGKRFASASPVKNTTVYATSSKSLPKSAKRLFVKESSPLISSTKKRSKIASTPPNPSTKETPSQKVCLPLPISLIKVEDSSSSSTSEESESDTDLEILESKYKPPVTDHDTTLNSGFMSMSPNSSLLCNTSCNSDTNVLENYNQNKTSSVSNGGSSHTVSLTRARRRISKIKASVIKYRLLNIMNDLRRQKNIKQESDLQWEEVYRLFDAPSYATMRYLKTFFSKMKLRTLEKDHNSLTFTQIMRALIKSYQPFLKTSLQQYKNFNPKEILNLASNNYLHYSKL